MADSMIHDVSDTALWVAVYRAQESKRPDALFHDTLASRLAGERGRKIATTMTGSRYTAWSVVMRTYVIDSYICELVKSGVDTVINLGAGLDTRPYRLDLPSSLRWFEVDYPQIIRLKQEKLDNEEPRCQLKRIEMDLSNLSARQKFFNEVRSESRKVLVLTEGVTPYLSPEQVASLAQDLRRQENFCFWIADYYAPQVVKYIKSPKRMQQMKNAPFQFFPSDWFGFFESQGWKAKETRYLGEESVRIGKSIPMPLWAKIVIWFTPKKKRVEMLKMSAYVVLEPK